jgi:hypothetical protein
MMALEHFGKMDIQSSQHRRAAAEVWLRQNTRGWLLYVASGCISGLNASSYLPTVRIGPHLPLACHKTTIAIQQEAPIAIEAERQPWTPNLRSP